MTTKKSFEIAPQTLIDSVGPYVDRVLEACGIEDAMVTDESSVSDFRPSWSPKDGPENDAFYAEVSKNIGFKVGGPDTIYGLAARLRGTN